MVVTWGATGTMGCAHDEIGTGVWVASFAIDGNHALSNGDITDRLATQKTGWWPFASKKWFDQAAFDLDLDRIVALYADHGFFDARVIDHQVRRRGDAADVFVRVHEGAPTQIGEVRFQGLPPEQERPARKLAAELDVRPGRRFNYDDYATLRSRLADSLRGAGYAYGKIEGQVDVDRDRHVATITVTGQPGPKVRFGKTTVEGNGNIPAHALLNRVTWKEGDTFDPRDISRTQGRIYAFGVFSSVRLELPETPASVADVRIRVRPGPLREVRLGGGVAAERQRMEARLRLEYGRSNFLGGLRRLRIRVQPAYVFIPSVFGPVRQGVAAQNEVQVSQPDIFGSNVTLQALAGYDVGVADGYQFHGPRGSLGAERPFLHDRVLAGLSWNLQYLNFYNVDQDVFNDASSRFYGFKNPYRLAFLEEFAQIDLRDRPLDPHYGGYMMIRVEQGDPLLGGDFHYVKTTPDLRLYAPLGRRTVAAVRGLVGWIHPFGADQSPITRRYALGGPASHRGFSLGRLAPQVLDSQGRLIPVGGNGEVLFSGELRIELTKMGGNWLGVAPFFDAGDVTARFADLDLGNLHFATGAALEYETPIGVVRAGLGVRLNRMGDGNPDPNDRIAFHITIGEAF